MSRYEQPDYQVISTCDGYEIRHYNSYLVAETVVSGSFEETGNAAFRRLAGFIFGRNSDSVKMNMTVPVTHVDEGGGAHRYGFVMEKSYTEDELPKPLDSTVTVRRKEAGYFAASRYRGSRAERRFRRAESELLAALHRDDIEPDGLAVRAVYDGPFVPAPLRRNEVLVPMSWSDVPTT